MRHTDLSFNPVIDFSLHFVCPRCKALPQQKCHGSNGTPPLTSHAERLDIANGYQTSAAFREDSPLSLWRETGPQF
jgi:hypothetical protein